MNKLFKSKTSKIKQPPTTDEKFSASVISDAITDTNTVEGRFARSASLFDGSASVLSEESFLSETFDDLDNPKAQRKITVQDAKFVEKYDWKKNSGCIVCSRKMDKLKGVNRHHCRLCAYGVCGECSKKRVNKSRVCDTCFFKQKTDYHVKLREQYLNSKSEKLVQDENTLQKKKEEAASIKTKVSQAHTDIDNTQETINKALENLEKSKEEVFSGLSKKKQVGDKLKHDLEKSKREIRDREERLRNLKTKISVLKLQLSQKKALIDNKKEELDELQLKKGALEYRTKNPSDSIVEGRASFANSNKNYSLVSADKGGKYNISMQPVNI